MDSNDTVVAWVSRIYFLLESSLNRLPEISYSSTYSTSGSPEGGDSTCVDRSSFKSTRDILRCLPKRADQKDQTTLLEKKSVGNSVQWVGLSALQKLDRHLKYQMIASENGINPYPKTSEWPRSRREPPATYSIDRHSMSTTTIQPMTYSILAGAGGNKPSKGVEYPLAQEGWEAHQVDKD